MLDKFKKLSIRSKIIIIFLVVVLSVFFVINLSSRNIILDNYLILEKERQERNINRYKNIIANNINNLSTKVSDWAFWDDTYYFIKNKNRAYIDSNLTNTTFSSLDINGMFFINQEGGIVFRKMIDIESNKELSPEEFTNVIKSNKNFIFQKSDESFSGFVKTDRELLFFVSKPVTKSDGSGPIIGSIIFTKTVNETFWNDLANLVQYPIENYDYDSNILSSDTEKVKSLIKEDVGYYIDTTDKDFVYGYFLIYDIHNNPVSIIKVITPNDIYKRGLFSFNFFITSLFVLISVFILVIYFLFELLVFRRIIKINNSIKEINDSDSLDGRIKLDNNDEIGDLISAINNFLDEINETRLRESKYIESEKKAVEDLKIKMDEVAKLNKLMVGRELKMLELKSEIDKLKKS